MRERENFDCGLNWSRVSMCIKSSFLPKERKPCFISSGVLVKHAPSAKNTQNSLTPVTLHLYLLSSDGWSDEK